MEKRHQHPTNSAIYGKNIVNAPQTGLNSPVSSARSRAATHLDQQGNSLSNGFPPGFPNGHADGFPTGRADALPIEVLERWFETWISDGEIRLHSPETTALRREIFKRLFRWLRANGHTECGSLELGRFLVSLRNERTGAEVSIAYNQTFRRLFKIFWKFLVEEGVTPVSAMAKVPDLTRAKRDMVPPPQPLGDSQLDALEKAAKKSACPRRDYALLLLALDTGLRRAELANIQLCDLSLSERSITVVGKGSKKRTVFLHPDVVRALCAYLRERGISPDTDGDAFLFVALRGARAGRPMRPNGIYQVIEKLFRAVGIRDGKRGTHRLRHTCATAMVRAGCDRAPIQHQLGHADPKTTDIYITLAQADLQRQHATYSPVGVRSRR